MAEEEEEPEPPATEKTDRTELAAAAASWRGERVSPIMLTRREPLMDGSCADERAAAAADVSSSSRCTIEKRATLAERGESCTSRW